MGWGFGSHGVILLHFSPRDASARLRSWFPDREFFMRSQGQVRFITVSGRAQLIAAATIAAVLVGWLAIGLVIALSHAFASHDRQALLTREARVARAEARLATYAHGLNGVVDDLQRRQDFITRMVQAHIGDLPPQGRAGETVSDSRSEGARGSARAIGAKVSAALPEAAGLGRIEARQLAFVKALSRYADRRAGEDEKSLRRLGLDPASIEGSLDRNDARHNEGMGGPLLALSTSADGSLDPRFARLGASLARMDALEHGLLRLPQVLPADLAAMSSGFGYRADPFTGAGAFHPGLDFRGPIGAPIHAAARGVVSFAGQRSGYGNCLEIDHGGGLVTRYAHMSAFRAHAGERVAAGQIIGAIGSTGRSTGPHLHFEVRIDDRPVNPRPFLEGLTHVSQKTGARQSLASAAASD